MRPWILAFLIGCGDSDTADSVAEPDSAAAPSVDASCRTWVSCCAHQCGTESAYQQWVKDDINCSVECDTANPGPLPASCVEDEAGGCAWAP